MNDKEERKDIHLEWDLPHAPAKVWRALTEPQLLAKWLMSTDMQPTQGSRFTFRQEATQWWDGIVHCEMLDIEPQRRIRYSWRSGTGNLELDTIVTWTLAPSASGGTKLALEHSGFLAKNKFAFDGARQGWEHKVAQVLSALLGEEN